MRDITLTQEEQQAKKLVESLRPMQENPDPDGYIFPCPRCGHERMKPEAVRNALSRYADVYICSECGMDEAMRDTAGQPPLPFTEWGMVLGFTENEDEEEGEEEKPEVIYFRGDKVLSNDKEMTVPQVLVEIQATWAEWAREYGDAGSCVLGAGFEFDYEGKRYKMPPTGPWQGSCSWEAGKDQIEERLKAAGATNIQYHWGVMD